MCYFLLPCALGSSVQGVPVALSLNTVIPLSMTLRILKNMIHSYAHFFALTVIMSWLRIHSSCFIFKDIFYNGFHKPSHYKTYLKVGIDCINEICSDNKPFL